MRSVIGLICFLCILFFSSSMYENFYGIVYTAGSLLFVLGGTVAATLISFPLKKIKRVYGDIIVSYGHKPFNFSKQVSNTAQIARNYKKYGFKTLETASDKSSDKYFRLGLKLIADNTEWQHIQSALEKEFILNSMQHDNAERIIRSMARFAPSFGLAGTIVGLIRIFPQLENPSGIGGALSLALLTTLYGVLASNLLFLPLANKLKDKTSDDEIVFRFIVEALACINAREYSIVIEQRLSALIPKHELEGTYGTSPSARLKLAENS